MQPLVCLPADNAMAHDIVPSATVFNDYINVIVHGAGAIPFFIWNQPYIIGTLIQAIVI